MGIRRGVGLSLAAVAVLAVPVAATASASAAAAPPAAGGTTYRVNPGWNPKVAPEANFPSTRARISQDGRSVVYQSVATNLVAGDKNNVSDVFFTDISDPARPVTKIVSIGADGTPANGISTFCEVSGDGHYVVFTSTATNLIAGGNTKGIFRRDMSTGQTVQIMANATRPVISDDGRFVGYNMNTNSGTYVKDMDTGRILTITSAPAMGDDSLRPEISGDGTHVVFAADGALVAADTNGKRDVYLADITSWHNGAATTKADSLILVSQTPAGAAGNGISSRPGINHDGSVVSFQSFDTNLVDPPTGDVNGKEDAFVRDYRTNPAGVTRQVSIGSNGLSATGMNSRPQLDDSGDIVTWISTGNSVVPNDKFGHEDVFITDLRTNKTVMVSVNSTRTASSACSLPPKVTPAGEGYGCYATRPYLSGNGNTVVFVAGQQDLVAGDTNQLTDIFVRTGMGLTP